MRGTLLRALMKMHENERSFRDSHGNVSFIDRDNLLLHIKPSGIPYGKIDLSTIVTIDLRDMSCSPSDVRPSVDLPHHISIYENNKNIKAICHTHSPYVVAHAISALELSCMTTEHADYFGHHVRVLPYRDLDSWGDFELYSYEKAVILGNHGGLTFANDPVKAVELSLMLENIAEKNHLSRILLPTGLSSNVLSKDEMNKWHKRYSEGYGQKKE